VSVRRSGQRRTVAGVGLEHMKKFAPLEAFLQHLRRRLQFEHDPQVNDGLRNAIQITDLLSQVVDSLLERDRLLEKKFKAAVKAVDHNNSIADSIRKSAIGIRSSDHSSPPDLLGAWTDVEFLKSKRNVLQLWFATEAFVFACYRQAVGHQLHLLGYGILGSPHDVGDWAHLEKNVADLISAAGAASPVAQWARNDKRIEEQVGSKLCSSLEALAGIAAAIHLLTVEWRPPGPTFVNPEDTFTGLEVLFNRSATWLTEAVKLLEVPVGYRPSAEIESMYS
jgi:hypothetical protein